MPDHVKIILKRAHLEDKPYNDIVLQLEREKEAQRPWNVRRGDSRPFKQN